MKEKLCKILACPYCFEKIEPINEKSIKCLKCERVFMIKNNIPLMLDPVKLKDFQNTIDFSKTGYNMKRDFIKKFTKAERIRKLLAPPLPFLKMNIDEKIKFILNHAGEETITVNIGSGGIRLNKKVINLDTYEFPEVDIIGDAHQLPFCNESVDSIIMVAVLEHIQQPQVVMQEMYRVLKRGGYIYIDVPFLAHYHGFPHDYQRYTLSGLEELCHQFQKIDSGVVIGPSSALCELLRVYVTFFSHNFYIQKVLQGIVGWLTFPLKYLDLWLIKNKDTYIAAYANFIVGKKV